MKNNVRHAREQLGINQTQLAELCGVSRQSIHAVETNTFKPSVLLALKIAKVLKTEVSQLFVLEKED